MPRTKPLYRCKKAGLHKFLACFATCALSCVPASIAHADAVRYTPYFENSVWMGDIHLNVVATDFTSKMEGYSKSRASYCLASQENASYSRQPTRGKSCFAQVSQMKAIKSSSDYAYYRTV